MRHNYVPLSFLIPCLLHNFSDSKSQDVANPNEGDGFMLGRLTLPRFRLREAFSHASHCLVTIAYDYM